LDWKDAIELIDRRFASRQGWFLVDPADRGLFPLVEHFYDAQGHADAFHIVMGKIERVGWFAIAMADKHYMTPKLLRTLLTECASPVFSDLYHRTFFHFDDQRDFISTAPPDKRMMRGSPRRV
jgi:hypothetical protein